MDFVDWCGLVLRGMLDIDSAGGAARQMGFNEKRIASVLFGAEIVADANFQGSSRQKSISWATNSLESVGLIESIIRAPYPTSMWRISQSARRSAGELIALWSEVCGESLSGEQAELLRLINSDNQQLATDHVCLTSINQERIYRVTDWGDDRSLTYAVAEELSRLGLIGFRPYAGATFDAWPTYKGLVWQTRRGFTLESQRIDKLVEEWETTSVDFKRELKLGTKDEKAEFIKDVIALVNTQASGPRLLIVGFSNDRTYYGTPSSEITQDRIEQILSHYVSPSVDVRYRVIDYRDGQIGELEIKRDARKLPHSVAESIGDKKRIEAGEIFVRHGSHSVKPDEDELNAIRAEADRAKARDGA